MLLAESNSRFKKIAAAIAGRIVRIATTPSSAPELILALESPQILAKTCFLPVGALDKFDRWLNRLPQHGMGSRIEQ